MKFARSSESARNSSTVRRRLIYCFQFYIINDEWMIEKKKKRKKIGKKKEEIKEGGKISFHNVIPCGLKMQPRMGRMAGWFYKRTIPIQSTRVRDIYLKKKKNVRHAKLSVRNVFDK